jgi:AcrR family transcriptional regulator
MRILEAAGQVFARKGLAATMDDIAAEAAVSHGLAYRYFANKEAIFYELVMKAFRASPSLFEPVLEAPDTAWERLASVVTGLVASRRQPAMYQLMGQVLADEATPEDLRELVRRRGQELRGVLRQLIVEGQAARVVAPGDPDQLVRAILACVEGLTRSATYYAEGYEEHYPDAAIFLRMLKP